MYRQALFAALTVLFVACGASAQDEDRVLLRYKWNAGEETVWDVTSVTSGTMVMRDLTKDPVEETPIPMWTQTVMPMSLLVESVDEEGNGTIVYELGEMQMDVQAEGRQVYMVYDPATGVMTVDGEEVAMPGGMATGLAGPYRMVMSPLGEVLELELPEGAGGALPGGMDMTQWMRMSQQWSTTLPEEPVGVDYVWSARFDAPIEGAPIPEAEDGAAPQGAMLYRMTGTRFIKDVECVTLEMLGAMDLETLPVPTPGAMVGGMDGGDFDLSIGPMHISMSGGFDFDAEAGRVMGGDVRVVMDMVQRMKGTMQTPEGQQEMDMEIISRGMTVDSTIEAR